jgi:hypothetical protein
LQNDKQQKNENKVILYLIWIRQGFREIVGHQAVVDRFERHVLNRRQDTIKPSKIKKVHLATHHNCFGLQDMQLISLFRMRKNKCCSRMQLAKANSLRNSKSCTASILKQK